MIGSNIKVFKAFGIPVEINVSWFIVFLLVLWSLTTGYFPLKYPALSPLSYLAMGVVGSLMLFVSVLLHEIAHSYVAKNSGVPIRRITLFLFGGISQLSKEAPDPKTELKIAIAGPLTSYVLMGIFLSINSIIIKTDLESVAGVIRYLAYINAALATFNLIPGFPLDGGRVLRAALWGATGDLRRSTYIASRVGTIIGFAFIGGGFLSAIFGQFIWGIWLAFIGFFLRQAAEASYAHVLVESILKGVTVGEIMKSDVVTVPEEISIQSLIDDYFFRYHYDCFPATSQGRLKGLIQLDDLRNIPRHRWLDTKVSQVMRKDLENLIAHTSDDASEVLKRMVQGHCGKIPIVDGENVVGIVTRKDIIEALRIISDLGK